MSHILVISDNEILNQLYITNLEVYLGAKVSVVDSTQKALEAIKKSPVKLVISMSMIDEQDSATFLYNHFAKNKMSIPLIIIGSLSKELSGVVVVPSSYHLKNLIRSCAQILGTTAKEMIEREMPKFYPVEIKFLLRIKDVPCSVYLLMKDSTYTLVAKKGDNIIDISKKFIDEGVGSLYVNSLDRLLIINTISINICDYLKGTESLDITQKSEALKTGFQFAAASFSEAPAAVQEILNIAHVCTQVMEDITRETPSLKKLMSLLNSQRDGYIYVHSILASYISSYIIKRVSWGGVGHIDKINFVLFFHDILLAPLYLKFPDLRYEEDLLFSPELSDKEKEVVLNHARMAAEVIVMYKKSPIGVDLLIKQHHGMTNGMGFAIDFKDDISPISKIVIISEAFVEELLRAQDENPNYVLNSKKIVEILQEKFKRTTYKKIIETLEQFPI